MIKIWHKIETAMRCTTAAVIAVAFLFAVIPPACVSAVQNPAHISDFRSIPGVTEDEIAAIEALQKRGTPLIYATAPSTETFQREDGSYGGYTALLCEWLSLLFGIPFQLETHSLGVLLEGLQNGDIDFATLSDNPERRMQYFMTPPIAQRSIVKFTLPGDRPQYRTEHDMLPRYVSVENSIVTGIIYDTLDHDSYELIIVPNEEDAYRTLEEKRGDYFVATDNVEAMFDHLGGLRAEPFLPQVFLPSAMAAANKEYEAVISLISKAIENGADRHLADLYRQGYQDYIKNKFLMSLTDEEKAYIQNNPIIPYVTQYMAYPVSFYNDAAKRWEGIAFDILPELETLTGFTFEIKNSRTDELPELLDMLERGEAYFMPSLVYSNEHAKRFIWTETAFMTDRYALLSKQSYPDVILNNVSFERVGMASNTTFADMFREWFPDAGNTKEYPTINAMFDALERGEIDLAMSGLSRLSALTNYYELSDYKANYVFNAYYDLRFGLNKDQTVLRSILDKALLLIETDRTTEKWTSRTFNIEYMRLRQQQPFIIGITLILVLFLMLFIFLYTLNLRKTNTISENNAKLKIMARATKIALWDIFIIPDDPTAPGNEYRWSDEFRQLLGYSSESEFPNKAESFLDAIHPDDKAETLDAFNKHISDITCATPYDVEYRLMTKSGEYRYFRTTSEASREKDSKICHSVGALMDITEKKQEEVLLRNAKNDLSKSLIETEKARVTLEQREKLLRVLNETAVVFLSNSYEEFNDIMSKGVGIIADTWDLDAMSVFRNTQKNDGIYITQVYSWERELGGTAKPREELQDIPFNEFAPIWTPLLEKGQTLNGPTSSMTPHEAKMLHKFGIVSIYAAPVFINSELWGFVSFEDYKNERCFDESSAEIMRSAAFLCVNAIIRGEIITQLREATIKAHEDEERMRLIIDSLPISCFMVNRAHKIIDVNQAALNLFGLDDANGINEQISRFMPEMQPCGRNSIELRAECFERAFKEGYTRVEFINQNIKGEPLPCDLTLIRVKYKGEDILVVYSRDLREQIALIEEIRKVEIAEESNRVKSRFLANMSHEIRTPMNSVIGFSELARDYYDVIPPQVMGYLDNISESAEWLLGIINDILDVSKIENGKMELEYIPFDIRKTIEYCRSAIIPKATKKGLVMDCYIDLPEHKRLKGDPVRLRQVLINLLSNAVKFTDTGTVALSVIAEDSGNDNMTVRFEVRDSGIGMTPEQILIIFDPFAQADSTISRRYGGTGLGLAICKNIIDMMGGELKVESSLGAGSCFCFELTFETTDQDDAATYASVNRAAEKLMFKGKVLVCEDNALNRKVIIKHLQRVGINPIIAENGAEAVEAVTNCVRSGGKPFDLIFMDIHMPVMNGLQAAKEISKLGISTPIVAMTANIMSGDLETYKKAGMDGYLGKPFTSAELCQCLSKYIEYATVANASKETEYIASESDREEMNRSFRSSFAKVNRDTYEKIINALNCGDIEEAHMLTHALKSNAGFIGETRLQNYAAEAEFAIKGGENRLTDRQLDNLKTELESVLNKIGGT